MACALALLPLPAVAEAPPPAVATAAAEIPPLREQVQSFAELGLKEPETLRGVDGTMGLRFSIRRDETVARAKLRLLFTYSPALLPELSHLRVTLNGEPIAVVPLPKAGAGTGQTTDIEVDPRYFTDYNRLGVQLIGHYTLECEEPLHTSLWATISDQSRLELSLRPLPQNTDLALLPGPFFDDRDGGRLELPFAFAGNASLAVLRAAGVAASWFGALADYRSARFPVLLDQMPGRHALVFVTDAERPSWLDDRFPLPVADPPSISLVDHPDLPAVKLLVIRGTDAAALRRAVEALVLGHIVLSGRSVAVQAGAEEPRRAAYDAPNWARTDRLVQMGELVDAPADLQGTGISPGAIRINLRLPPDLLTWNQSGLPIDLKYRYTPPPERDNSVLSVSINDEFVKSLRLKPAGQGLKIPGLAAGQVQAQDEVVIPAFRIGSDNQLQFEFSLDHHKSGICKNMDLKAMRVAIDPDSTVDATGFPHYAALPDLSLFANGGFPFTTYADLAETAVVLPDAPAPQHVEAMLFLLGRMGRITGTPALRFRLLAAAQVEEAEDADLLVIDGTPAGGLLAQWNQRMPALIEQGRREVDFGRVVRGWLPPLLASTDETPEPTRVAVTADGPLSALVAFESPLQGGRSVVAIAASGPEFVGAVLDALESGASVRRIRGDLALVQGAEVESLRTGPGIYHVGRLSLGHWFWYHLSRHPVWVTLLGLMGGALLALGFYVYVGRVAARRLGR